MNPQPNEVWRTKSGRLCLIVAGPLVHDEATNTHKHEPMMVWLDQIDGHFSVSKIHNRLEERVNIATLDFFAQFQQRAGVIWASPTV